MAKLTELGLMEKAEQDKVELVKKNSGTWDALNEVDQILTPEDIEAAFKKTKAGWKNFDAFPKLTKLGILEWIQNAKRPDTRLKRIEETVNFAKQSIRVN